VSFLPITQMRERVIRDQSESDVAAYLALMYFGELVVKIIVSAMVSGLSEDAERQRYGFLYRLVRANGIGEWARCLREICTGPASHLLDPELREERRELANNVTAGKWQHEAVLLMHACAIAVAPEHPEVPKKIPLLHWFDDFSIVRNKTRGHGAKRAGELGGLCENLQASIELVSDNFRLFQREWAYLFRNISKKYRVNPLSMNAPGFDDLKQRRDVTLSNGVYVLLGAPQRVDLLRSDPDASDFALPNGSFTSRNYELISYATGGTVKVDSSQYQKPLGQLPRSETEGEPDLGVVGSMLTNIPPEPVGYVRRIELEKELRQQLLLEHHPIVTLSGYGGIGKTSLALRVLHDMANENDCPYSVCVWFSARDIDLLLEGAKRVRPRGVSLSDFAEAFADLIGDAETEKDFDAVKFLATYLSNPGSLGRILFVFDNFETVESPGEVFDWIDTHVRTPNKVLVTTRIRGDFQADYPLFIHGMSEEESMQLIQQTGRFLGISELLDKEESWCRSLVDEASGHPYVMKILLGEVARTGILGRPRRVVASRDKMLDALFERTYESLSPGAQRVLLTMANWNSSLPEIGLEAVLLQNLTERLHVQEAIDELVQASLVLRDISTDSIAFLELPLAAHLFAKKKLEVSAWRSKVEIDTDLLKAFGASRGDVDKHGIGRRMSRFFKKIAERASEDPSKLEVLRPVLEYMATAYQQGWLILASLYDEMPEGKRLEHVKRYYRKFLENPDDVSMVSRTWLQLANVCRGTDDLSGELHSLVAMSQVTDLPMHVISNAANRVNARLSELSAAGRLLIGQEERQVLLLQLVKALEEHEDEMDAVDFSRLGWLYTNYGDTARALDSVHRGLALDESNEYCQSLERRLQRTS